MSGEKNILVSYGSYGAPEKAILAQKSEIWSVINTCVEKVDWKSKEPMVVRVAITGLKYVEVSGNFEDGLSSGIGIGNLKADIICNVPKRDRKDIAALLRRLVWYILV